MTSGDQHMPEGWPQCPDGYCLELAGPGQEQAVAGLMAAYFRELDLTSDPEDLDHDLVDPLAGYETGGLLLVRKGDVAVGCAGLREIEPKVGELKRMYLDPGHRSQGLGRLLLDAALALARTKGFTRLVLDTRLDLKAANRLYEKYGFRDIADYNQNPRAQRFMALDL